MSDIKELIREKIDAFYTEYKAKFHQNGDSYHLGIIDGLDMAERILDALPDEPVSNDLKEAAEKSAVQYYVDGGYSPFQNIETASHIAGFKAGAEWQKKQDEENYAWVKQLPNPNIEKLDGIEITKSDSSAGGKELLYVSNKSYNIGFRDGMDEQKRKMMEDHISKETAKKIARGSLGVQDFIRKIDRYTEDKQ